MRRAMALIILGVVPLGAVSAYAQAPSPPHTASRPDADRLGLSCAQILKMTPSDWIDYYGKKTGPLAADRTHDILNANAAYGRCYDARTDALAASLAGSGKGPGKAARAEFASFEAALKEFETTALADTHPAGASGRKSYADLYEKQFRYEFFQEYQVKATKTANAPAPPAKPGASAPAATSGASAGARPGGASSSSHDPSAEERTRSDADPVTQAKNRFGKILEALPDDQMHEIHRAFSEVIGPYSISEPMRLAVYHYAIYILQPEGAAAAEPPPF
jgi:hypothetical protein